jgi:hypothetical protein
MVGKMLETLGYSRQVNRKTNEDSRHPDRDGQFRHINRQLTALQATGQPVISVVPKERIHRRVQERRQRLPRRGAGAGISVKLWRSLTER